MCTVNIKVDERAMRRINPELTNSEKIGKWLQSVVDEMLEGLTEKSHGLSPNAHTAEAMKSIVLERIGLMEAGKAAFVDGEEGFAQIRARHGL